MQKFIFLLCLSVFSLFAQYTWAHGSMEVPISRSYNCYREGPENLTSEACRAAIRVGEGTQALYDWDMINQFNADDHHRDIIPDGTLCAGGRAKYEGMNLPRTDWFTTTIRPDTNGHFNFVFRATVPHAVRYFELYLTKDSYNPAQPLKWSDLDPAFCRYTTVTLDNGRYNFDCVVPPKTGRRILYMIWQRSDSPEAFYSCSDIIISNENTVNWRALENLKATQDVTPNSTLKFWLMRNCEDVESYSVTIANGQHTATIWPYYLAQGVNSRSTFVNIGQLNTDTNRITPVQSALDNRVYVKSNDINPYFFMIDFIRPNSANTQLFATAQMRRQYCLAHQINKKI